MKESAMRNKRNKRNWIFGYCEISLEGKVRTKLLELFLECPIPYWNLTEEEDATICRILKRDAAVFLRECKERGLHAKINFRAGLPALLHRYRRRPGIPVGIIIIAAAIYISGLFIWDINVSGNKRMSEAEILQLLESHGVYVGSYIPSLELQSIYNSIIIESGELAWLSVNIRGTVANVEIREIDMPDNRTTGSAPSNVIAASDGQIATVEVYNGQAQINPGDTVREGSLLISGVTTDKNGVVRVVHGSGRVMARTNRTITVKIPLIYDKKIYTGRSTSNFSYKIFSFPVNISKNGSIEYEEYDKIITNEQLSFYGMLRLPVWYERTAFCEYTTEKTKRSETEAVRMAGIELANRIAELPQETEILSRTVNAYFTDDSYVLECSMLCLENIAKIVEIEIQ